MDEVIPPDSHQVTVTRDYGDQQFRPSELYASCEGDGQSVRAVEGIQLHVSGDSAGATDARDNGCLVKVNAALFEGTCEAPDDRSDAAGGAPDVRNSIHPQERCYRMLH